MNVRRRIYTEGEEEDLHDNLMEITGWTVTDKEKGNDFSIESLEKRSGTKKQ